jgi:hypothetical protein
MARLSGLASSSREVSLARSVDLNGMIGKGTDKGCKDDCEDRTDTSKRISDSVCQKIDDRHS